MILLVNRTDLERTAVGDGEVPAGLSDPSVVILGRETGQNRVTVRKIEHHIVTSSDVPESFQTAVVILDESRVGLLTEDYIVRERDRERSLRHLRAESHFADEEVVSRKERALHRG